MEYANFRWRLWYRLVQVVHVFGFHSRVDCHEYDPMTDSVVYVGMVCVICGAE